MIKTSCAISIALLLILAGCGVDYLDKNQKYELAGSIENEFKIIHPGKKPDEFNRYYHNDRFGVITAMYVSKQIRQVDHMEEALCADHMQDRGLCERAKKIVRDLRRNSSTWVETTDDFPAIHDAGCLKISFTYSSKTNAFLTSPECN